METLMMMVQEVVVVAAVSIEINAKEAMVATTVMTGKFYQHFFVCWLSFAVNVNVVKLFSM